MEEIVNKNIILFSLALEYDIIDIPVITSLGAKNIFKKKTAFL